MTIHAGTKNGHDNANAVTNTGMGRHSWKTYLWGVLALSALVRVLLLLAFLHASGTNGVYDFDTAGYVAPIQGMVHGSFSTINGPELGRTPGYPIFLMLTGMAGNHPLLSISCQILLACFSVFLVYKIGLLLFKDERVAVLCAFLYAIEPNSVFHSVQLLSEALFTPILIVFIYQLLRYILRPSWGPLIWSALALSATVYVRPVSYYLPLFCAAGLALVPMKIDLAPKLWRATAFLLICAVMIGAWQVRNYVETGFSGFTTAGYSNLYYGTAVAVLANKEHTDFYSKAIKLEKSDAVQQAAWTIAQRSSFQKQQAMQIIRKNPVIFMKVQLRGIAAVLIDPNSTHVLKRLGLYPSEGYLNYMEINKGISSTLLWVLRNKPLIFIVTIVLAVILGIYYVLAFIGIPWLFIKKDVLITLVLIFIYFVAIAGGAVGIGRHREAVMPIVALFAGAGLARLAHPRRHT